MTVQTISGSPALKDLIAAVEERLRVLKANTGKAADVVAEIDATQRLQQLLANVITDAQLIAARDTARALMTPERYIEAPSTDGQNRAGVWLKPRIEAAMDALGIEHSPEPSPSASPQRKT